MTIIIIKIESKLPSNIYIYIYIYKKGNKTVVTKSQVVMTPFKTFVA